MDDKGLSRSRIIAEWSGEWYQELACGSERVRALDPAQPALFRQFSVEIHFLLKYTHASREFSVGPQV